MTRAYLAYFTERVRPGIFVPALVALWLMAFWTSGGMEARTFRSVLGGLEHGGSTFLLLPLLVLQFRLWDDLEDRERDRQFHPDRVIVRSNVEPFRWLLAALTTAAVAVAAATSLGVLTAVVTLDVLGVVAYRAIRPRVPDVVWRFPILLAKYPAFVAVTAIAMGGESWPRLGLAALAVMTGACVYEAVHHGRQPAGVAS